MTDAVACPKCLRTDTPVAETRPTAVFGPQTIRRRRQCVCGHRFATHEIPVESMGVVMEMWRAKGDRWRIQ